MRHFAKGFWGAHDAKLPTGNETVYAGFPGGRTFRKERPSSRWDASIDVGVTSTERLDMTDACRPETVGPRGPVSNGSGLERTASSMRHGDPALLPLQRPLGPILS